MNTIEMLDTKTGKVVKTFSSATDAARYVIDVLGYKRKVASVTETISKICAGKTCKTQYYGYRWQYATHVNKQYATKREIYYAVEHDGTAVDAQTGPDGAVYTLMKSILFGGYVVSCSVIDERDHFMVAEMSFDKFDDAYVVWNMLGKAAPSLFIQDDDEFTAE